MESKVVKWYRFWFQIKVKFKHSVVWDDVPEYTGQNISKMSLCQVTCHLVQYMEISCVLLEQIQSKYLASGKWSDPLNIGMCMKVSGAMRFTWVYLSSTRGHFHARDFHDYNFYNGLLCPSLPVPGLLVLVVCV